MTKNSLLYINHVIESIEKIAKYVKGQNYVDFCSNSMLYDAVIRNLQILAESTQKVSDSVKNEHPEVPWKDISGFRNILVHDYLDGIDEEVIWNIIVNDLAELKILFNNIKRELEKL